MDARTLCSGDESTLIPGQLRGYRCWNLLDNRQPPTLTALNFRFGTWPSTRMHAQCRRDQVSTVMICPCGTPGCTVVGVSARVPIDSGPDHAAPNMFCSCGLWAWYRPDDSRMAQGIVFGAINGYGRTLLGDYGFRSEHADIVALAYDGPQEVRDGLHERYGVPVYDSRHELAVHHQPDDIRSLVPTAFDGGELPYTRNLRSSIDPYLYPQLLVDGEPIWHYQLVAVFELGSGMTITLESRASGHQTTQTDPEIISLFLEDAAYLRRTSFQRPYHRSALLYNTSGNNHDDDRPRPSAPPTPVTPQGLALERRRNRPTGPRRNPFRRRGQ